MGPRSGQKAFSYQLLPLPVLPRPILASFGGLGTREKQRLFPWFRGFTLVSHGLYPAHPMLF